MSVDFQINPICCDACLGTGEFIPSTLQSMIDKVLDEQIKALTPSEKIKLLYG